MGHVSVEAVALVSSGDDRETVVRSYGEIRGKQCNKKKSERLIESNLSID